MPPGFDPKQFDGDTSYNIMFGPDICGTTKRTHAILNYKEKNHLIKSDIAPGSDQLTHLYTFVIHPNQTYVVLVDQVEQVPL
jgi:calreticulin